LLVIVVWGMNLHVYLVLTPNVLMLDYAGPAEALRMAGDMGAALTLTACGPQAEIPTSLGTGLTGIAPLPQVLPPNSLVLVVGNSNEVADYATEAAQQVVRWLRSAPLPDTRLATTHSLPICKPLLPRPGWRRTVFL
jgi:transcriptional regulator GlxA family with amidase domain